ncbi:hypothetical protein P7C73_g4208, partial [Tremellales sp. Uapishka_1]
MDHYASLVEAGLDSKHAAVLLVVLSDFCFVTMDGVIQGLQSGYGLGPEEILLFRMVFTSTLCLLWVRHSDPPGFAVLFTADKWLVWVRGTVNSLGIYTVYLALQYIALSEAVAIFHLRPFPVAFLCFVFLGERFTRIQLFASGMEDDTSRSWLTDLDEQPVLSFGAVVLIFPPEWLFGRVAERDTGRLVMGVCAAFASMLVTTLDFLLVRKIGDAVGVAQHLSVSAVAAVVVSVMAMVVTGTAPTVHAQPKAWVLMSVITVSGFVAQLGWISALKRVSGGTVAVLGYLQVPFAIAVQVIFTTTVPDWKAVLGMTVIIASGIWAAVRLSLRFMGADDAADRWCTQDRIGRAGWREWGAFPLLLNVNGDGRNGENDDMASAE